MHAGCCQRTDGMGTDVQCRVAGRGKDLTDGQTSNEPTTVRGLRTRSQLLHGCVCVCASSTVRDRHSIIHCARQRSTRCALKAAFHDTDIDILARILEWESLVSARILADTSDTRDFHGRILARMLVSVSWNAALTTCDYFDCTWSRHSLGLYHYVE